MSAAPPRPHPLARSTFAQKADRAIEQIWRRGLAEKPRLDPDYLWPIGAKGFSRADEVSIRSSEEVADFRERLDRLCRALREEAQLNALGHTMAYGQLKKAIRERHALGRLWRRQPERARTAIAPPILVIGQMRSGTTRVHRLLAADPRHVATRFCDSHHPVPVSPDIRPLVSRAVLALARRINPWLDTLHPFSPRRGDEEIGWLAAALSPPSYEAQWHIPSFVRWSERRDPAPVYAEFARILRTDADHAGNAHRPRVMKCPQFSEDMSALLGVFPDARLVLTQRDDRPMWESTVSMVAGQSAYQSDALDLATIEQEWHRRIAHRNRRLRAALANADAPLCRVAFDDLNEDWRGEMHRVYDAFGIEMTGEALEAMEAEVSRSESEGHVSHRAQVEAFGLGTSPGQRLRA